MKDKSMKSWNSKYEAKVDTHHYDIQLQMVSNWDHAAGTWLIYTAEVHFSQGSGTTRMRRAKLCDVQATLDPTSKILLSTCTPSQNLRSIKSTTQARTLRETTLDAVRQGIAETANEVRKVVYAEHG